MMMLVLLQRRLQTSLCQAPAAPTGWTRLNLSRPLALRFLMLSRARQLETSFWRKILLSLLLKLVVVLLQAWRSLLQQSHQLMLMLYRHNQIFFLVLDSPVAPAAAGVLPDDATTSTGDDDEDTKSDSYGEEVDHSIAATGLGKDP